MKKIVWAVIIVIVALGGGFLIWQNLPQKKYARHMVKARLFRQQNNYTAALEEYKRAYKTRDGYSPWVSLEVLNFENSQLVDEGKTKEAVKNTVNYVQDNPQNNEGKLILADLSFKAGELETAFNSLNRLLRDNPAHYEGRMLLADIRHAQGRLDLAENQLKKVLESHSDSIDPLVKLADNLLDQQKPAEARQLLNEALKKNPGLDRARLHLVDAWLRERKPESAQVVFSNWKNTDSTLTDPINLRQAKLYSLMGEYQQASEILAQYKDHSRENVPAMMELALVQARQGHYDSAIVIYTDAGVLDPKNEVRSILMGHLLALKSGNFARALALIKRTRAAEHHGLFSRMLLANYLAMEQEHKAREWIQQSPDSLQPELNDFLKQLEPNSKYIGQLGLVYYYQLNGQKHLALQEASQLYRQWPGNQLAIAVYAQELASIGQISNALEVMERLSNPTVEQRGIMMRLYASIGKLDRAYQIASKLLKEHPNIPGINAIIADFYLQKNQKQQAMESFKKELENNPNNLVALNNLAWEYGIEQDNMEKAKPYMDRLQKFSQHDPRILDTMGWILVRNGEYEEGQKYLNLALNLVPDNPEMLYHYGWMKANQGETEDARDYLQRALSMDNNFPARDQATQLLQKLN